MRVRLANDPEKETRDRLCHAAWGRRLTVAQFLARERVLRATPFARDAMRTWVAEVGGEIVASCETFRMRSRADGVDGESHGIASVYVEPGLRGRGFASAMTASVVAEVAREPGAQALLLFSEVGASLYERAGFVARPTREWSWPAEAGDPGDGPDTLYGPAALARALDRLPVPAAPFVVWPTADQLAWHLTRERWYAETLGRPRPPCCGAMRGPVTALWAGDFKGDTLWILAHGGEAPDAVAIVVRAARRTAHGAGLATVRMWATDAAVLPSDAREAPAADLPMLRALRAGTTADDWHVVPRGLWV